MAVRIRLKKLGRRHRPFFRVCAMDSRAPRDGRVIEELGTYDPMVPETDARARLDGERIDYWLSVGAKPTQKVDVLIKKYGKDGSHLDAQQQALNRIASRKSVAIASAQEAAKAAAEAETKRREEEEKKKEAEAAAAAEAKAAEEAAAAAEAETPADADGGESAEAATERKDRNRGWWRRGRKTR